MTEDLSTTRAQSEFVELLDEIFEEHHGIFLDPGTSLFQTLEEYDANRASIPVGDQCATIAAQVSHVTFFLDVYERYILTGDAGDNDWDEIWETVGEVNQEEWEAIKADLRAAYSRLMQKITRGEAWHNDTSLSGLLAIVAHTAYHLGEIRQALCVLR